MQILSKENKAAIIGAVRLKTERIDVPEWDATVIVSEMSGAARDAFYAAREGTDKVSVSKSQAMLLLAAVVDESGAPVLDENDIASLRAQSSVALDRISDVAMRLNSMMADSVGEAAKNSAAAPSGDSGSASQPVSVAQ